MARKSNGEKFSRRTIRQTQIVQRNRSAVSGRKGRLTFHHVQPAYEGGRDTPKNCRGVLVQEHGLIHARRFAATGRIEERRAVTLIRAYATPEERQEMSQMVDIHLPGIRWWDDG